MRRKTSLMKTMRNRGTVLFDTSWGWMGIVASERGICGVILPVGSKRSLARVLRERGLWAEGMPSASIASADGSRPSSDPLSPDVEKRLVEGRDQVRDYLEGRRRTLELPVDLSEGTAFQKRVWRTIERIPYGRVRSYGWVAAKMGGRRYARAVGRALGTNPVPILIPCHRILAHDGALGGFSGGLRTKQRLLNLEGIEGFTVPSARRPSRR